MISCDWAIDERRSGSGIDGATDDVHEFTLRSVDIDLNGDDQPQDFGEELLEGTYQGDEKDWEKLKRTLEATPSMLACLRMILTERQHAAGLDYAKRILQHIDR